MNVSRKAGLWLMSLPSSESLVRPRIGGFVDFEQVALLRWRIGRVARCRRPLERALLVNRRCWMHDFGYGRARCGWLR